MPTYEFQLEPQTTLREKIHFIERHFISEALRASRGRVTPAAHALGFPGHQSLVAIIKTRHPDLIGERSPVRPRRKPLMVRKPPRAPQTKSTAAPRSIARPNILLVSDGRNVAPLVQWPMAWSATAVGKAALDLLTGDTAFDVLVLCDTAEHAAEDLAARARRIQHRRKTPQLLLVANEPQSERAWKAGADALLVMPEEREDIVRVVARLLAPKGARQK